MDDGEDPDPSDELENQIQGAAQAVSCGNASSVVVLGVPIRIDAATEFHGVQDCAELAGLIAAGGRAHVEVEVTGDLSTALVATEVALEDADGDGHPDDVDEDDEADDEDDEDEEEEDDEGDEDGDDGKRTR
jgi:hypothetical protein